MVYLLFWAFLAVYIARETPQGSSNAYGRKARKQSDALIVSQVVFWIVAAVYWCVMTQELPRRYLEMLPGPRTMSVALMSVALVGVWLWTKGF